MSELNSLINVKFSFVERMHETQTILKTKPLLLHCGISREGLRAS